MKLQYKEFPGKVVNFDDATLTITHFISTETQDSGGDVMKAAGMKIRGKPVVLFQHGQDPNFGNEPIAKALKIEPGEHEGKTGVLATTQYFDDRKLSVPTCVGQRLYMKAKDDTMPNWSIGFNSTKEHPCEGGRVVDEWELHEYSQVSVGMNKEATTLSYKFVVKSDDDDDAATCTKKAHEATLAALKDDAEKDDHLKAAKAHKEAAKAHRKDDNEAIAKHHDAAAKHHEALAEKSDSKDDAEGAKKHSLRAKEMADDLDEKGLAPEGFKDLADFTAATSGKADPTEEITKSNKAPHLSAHKGIHAFHKEMMDDLKDAAMSDDLMDKGVDGCAKEALEDFAEGAGPHVEKYIKAVREMGKDDELPPMEGTEEPERKGGPGSGRHPEGGSKKPEKDRLSKKQLSDFQNFAHSEIDAIVAIEQNVGKEGAMSGLFTNTSPMTPEEAHDIVNKKLNGLKVLFNDMIKNEEPDEDKLLDKEKCFLSSKSYSDAHRQLHKARDEMIKAIHAHKGDKSVVPAEATKKILKDHHEAALPHAKAFIKTWRESHGTEQKPESDPAAPVEKVLKLHVPQAPAKKTIRLSIKAAPEPAITAATVQKLVAEGLKEWSASFRAELRRLSGKVTN